MKQSALVAEDDASIRNMLEFSLSMEGYEVSTASDGVAAMEILRSQPIDVALLDIMMPLMNGYQVFDAIRHEEGLTDMPVIMVTAKASDAEIWDGWLRGVDSYLTKPIDIEMLIHEVSRVTSQRCAA